MNGKPRWKVFHSLTGRLMQGIKAVFAEKGTVFTAAASPAPSRVPRDTGQTARFSNGVKLISTLLQPLFMGK